MTAPAFAASPNHANADFEAAKSALAALIDAGVSPDDPRCHTLNSLISLAAPPAPCQPSNRAACPSSLVRRLKPANHHDGFPRALVPVGTVLPPSQKTPFARENQNTIVATRLAMEGAFEDKSSRDVCASERPIEQRRNDVITLKKEPISIFHAAAALQMEKPLKKSACVKRKDVNLGSPTAPTNAISSPRASKSLQKATTDSPDASFQLAGSAFTDHFFQIRAQVDAFRRIVRGEKLPTEVLTASRGRPPKEMNPLPGSVVERGVPRADGLERSSNASLVPPKYSQFDVRRLPRFPIDHAFSAKDVTVLGEELSDQEKEYRVRLAQAHHERLHAKHIQEMRSKGINRRSDCDGMDQRIFQQRSELIESACAEDPAFFGSDREPNGRITCATVDTQTTPQSIPVQSSQVDSIVRDRAAVPISVVTKGKYAPSYCGLLAEREKLVNRRIQARIRELSDLPTTLPEEVKRKASMEAKQLKLITLQRRVRSQLRTSMKRVLDRPGPSDLRAHVEGLFKRRTPAHTFGGSVSGGARPAGLRTNFNHRVEQETRRRNRRANYMTALLTHAQDFRAASHSRVVLHKRLLKDLDKYFRDKSREEERRRKKEQMERLRALRSNNEDEYLELLKTTKNKRLIQLLKQTDEYLMQIGAQVERQKQAARDDDAANGIPADTPKVNVYAYESHKEQSSGVDDDDELQQLKKRRNDYYTITHTISENVYQPHHLVGGTLKPYQLEGLEWLVSLYNNNLNGILADEMGLGKTIQTLSLITYLVEIKRTSGPFLIIVPLSVMSNWVREMDLWAPSLVKVVYKGDPIARKNIQLYEMVSGSYNVLLTTYEFVVRDKHILGKIHWKYIIMDEGHRMKNADCKLALTLGAKYKSRNRLLLTGTPLQNNMTELWALLNFLLPTIFSSAETFETWFNAPFQASALGESVDLNEEENLLIISRLHQVLRPFMLRRLKTDVESQLPEKVEIVFRCEMSIWQRVLYRQMRARIGIAAGAGNVGFRSFNNMVMQLKKVCNHPFLFYNEEELMSIPRDFLIRASGKFELLEHCLRKLKNSGHRVLVFSQMTAALDYLEYFLSMIGMKHLRLDGTTKADDRQDMLEMFNAEESQYFCFLLSTRAGGLGLNLQSADTVIIFDSDWNPMMDLQAQDRAHRIGQTKEVRVFRLICAGSVEVKILERANRKLQIDAQVIQAGQFNNKSSDSDRKTMLKDLLRQQGEDDLAAHLDVTQLSDINKKLARSDDEFELFERMDEQSFAERQGKPRLLMDEADLPRWVLKPEADQERKRNDDVINLIEHGRGRRKRKDVLYDDNLTEREWTAAMEDEGDVQDAIRRKRRRLNSRVSVVDSSSGDEDETQKGSVKESPEQESDVEEEEDEDGDSHNPDFEEENKAELRKKTSVTKLAPFLDPELNETPKSRRKRGRRRLRKE